MIIQGSGNLRKMSLYDLFNDLRYQESTVLSNATKNGGPLALLSKGSIQVGTTKEQVSHHSRVKSLTAPEENNMSYDDSDDDDEDDEQFQ